MLYLQVDLVVYYQGSPTSIDYTPSNLWYGSVPFNFQLENKVGQSEQQLLGLGYPTGSMFGNKKK